MAKFKVLARMSSFLEVEMEAKDIDDAWLRARYIDGADYMEIPNSGDWDLMDITEVASEKV